jgi:hypothetical protein
MLTNVEKRPLPYLHLSELGIVAAAASVLGGMWLLVGGPERFVVLAVVMVASGMFLGFISGYYRGCANGSCTPGDT